MTPILFGTVYAGLLIAITCLSIERLIDKAQSKPILVQIAGNGESLSELLAAIVFALVEGAAKIAVAKGAR